MFPGLFLTSPYSPLNLLKNKDWSWYLTLFHKNNHLPSKKYYDDNLESTRQGGVWGPHLYMTVANLVASFLLKALSLTSRPGPLRATTGLILAAWFQFKLMSSSLRSQSNGGVLPTAAHLGSDLAPPVAFSSSQVTDFLSWFVLFTFYYICFNG